MQFNLRMDFINFIQVWNSIKDIQMFNNQIRIRERQPQMNKISKMTNFIFFQPGAQQLPLMNCTSYQSICISIAQIKSIDQLAKKEFPNLTLLRITQSRLQSLPSLSWKKLQIIDLRYNLIENIEIFSQSVYECLSQLDLYKNLLKSLPKLKTPQLKSLTVSYNKIETIDDLSQGHYQNLQVIQLENNQLVRIPKLLTPSLKQVCFSYNKIESIDDFALNEYSQLKNISIRDNKLVNLPALNTKNLSFIGVSNNQLQSIDQFAKNTYDHMWMLSVNNNKLRSLPRINSLKLSSIHSEENQIQNLEQFSKGQLPQLKNVYLDKNKVKNMPKFNCPNLYALNLAQNPVESISRFSQGQYYNKIQYFDVSFVNKEILFTLKLPNMLQTIYLQRMNLTDKQVQTLIDTKLVNLQQLSAINLKYNNLTRFPYIEKLPLCEILDISDNPLQNIDQIYNSQKYKGMQGLHFSNTKLTQPQIKEIETIRSAILNQIYLQNRNSYDDFLQQQEALQQANQAAQINAVQGVNNQMQEEHEPMQQDGQ